MDRLKCMEVFVQVVRTGSLSAGGAACGMSAFTAGKHVHALEQRLGQTLLRRAGRVRVATEVGAGYFAECVEVLARIADAETLARPTRARNVGQLRVSAPTAVGSHLLMPLFADYLREHPDVALDVALKDRAVDLEEEGIHAAFQAGGVPERGLVAHSLRGVRRIACASPSYLARCGVPRSPDDLAGHDCLGFSYDTDLRRWRFAGEDGQGAAVEQGEYGGRVRHDSRLTADNPLALVQAAVCGMGIAMLPDYLLSPEVAAGRLVTVLDGEVQIGEPMHLVHLAGRYVSSKLDDFVRYMVARLGPDAGPEGLLATRDASYEGLFGA